MRKILIFIILISSYSALHSQELCIDGLYAGSVWKKYSHNFGYNVGYNHSIGAKGRMSISYLYLACNDQYDDIDIPESEDTMVQIGRFKPHNVLNSIHMQYGHRIGKCDKASIIFGPEIGLNYYRIREEYSSVKDGSIQSGKSKNSFEENHKFGFGFFFEMNCPEVINKHMSLSLSAHPEITALEKLGMKGSSLPFFNAWLRFNLGIRYKLEKN